MFVRSLLMVVITLGTLTAPAAAHADPPSVERVRQMLSAYEQVPPATVWRALGPQTLEVLVALYNDPSEPTYIRLRSVAVAAHYPTAACRTFLRAVARAPGQSDLFIRSAILALGKAFGPQAVADIEPYLEHPEPVVREASIRALRRVGTPQALAAIRRRGALERDAVVRQTLERALR